MVIVSWLVGLIAMFLQELRLELVQVPKIAPGQALQSQWFDRGILPRPHNPTVLPVGGLTLTTYH